MPITYELAKKLKDAGFPFRWSFYAHCPLHGRYPEKENTCGMCLKDPCESVCRKGLLHTLTNESSSGMIASDSPTLDELIEACGEAFDALWFPPEGIDGKTKWCVKPKFDWRKFVIGEHDWVEGSSPEIAVANLWLALNKKD